MGEQFALRNRLVESRLGQKYMIPPGYAIGQAVFIRTDTVEYIEETVPFKSLEEMLQVSVSPRPNLALEKIVVFSMVDNEPCALTLGFVSASKGERPGDLDTLESWK